MKIRKFDILWEVFFSALSTGYLSTIINANSIIVGLVVGVFATVVAFFLLKIYDKNNVNDEVNKEN